MSLRAGPEGRKILPATGFQPRKIHPASLQVRGARILFPVGFLEFTIYLILPQNGRRVGLVCNRNEYQGSSLGVKAAGS